MLDISKSALIIIANIYLAQWRPSEINIGHTIQKASEMSFSTANHTFISHKLCISVRHRKNKSTLDNSPPPNYDKESKDECHHVNNNPRYKWYVKPAAFQVIAPTRSNYGRKINVKNGNKLTILIFLPAIIELVQELLISNIITNLRRILVKMLKLSRL